MDLLIDLYLYGQARQAQAAASQAKDAAREAGWEIEHLRRRVEALTLACQALWEVLRTQQGLSDEMILRRMREIDLRDGKADGKISTRVVACPACARPSESTRKTCIYCGARLPAEKLFEKI